MKLYAVINWVNRNVICLCQTRADAEEMILSLVESTPYEDYLNYGVKFDINTEYFLYDPLTTCNYYISNPAEIVPS